MGGISYGQDTPLFEQGKRLHSTSHPFRQAPERKRFQVLSALLGGFRPREIVAVLGVSRATVYRVRRFYLDGGVQALSDGRSIRGRRKVTPAYLTCLARETDARPVAEDEGASNWTLKRLARRLGEITGIWIHFTWLWQILRQIGFGRKRTRPVVHRCNPRRRWQWAALVRILRRIRPGEVLLFADEADIDFNPKTGFPWCSRGLPAEIETPGRNQKQYLEGALNVDTGRFLCVDLDIKASPLFVHLLRLIRRSYRYAGRIHILVDNYSIHKSGVTRRALASAGGRIKLHYLPTYSPELNPVEHVWSGLHNAITRNHRFPTMNRLMDAVRTYLRSRGRYRFKSPLPVAVTRHGLAFSDATKPSRLAVSLCQGKICLK